MPCAVLARNELDDFATPADEKVCGNLKFAYGPIIGMRLGVEPVGEQLEYSIAAKLIRRKADVVDDEQVYFTTGGPFVKIGRRNKGDLAETNRSIDLHLINPHLIDLPLHYAHPSQSRFSITSGANDDARHYKKNPLPT
jgi:hypothetical protein